MGTVPEQKPETVGVIERAGETIRLIEQRVERRAIAITNDRTRTLGDVIAAVLLVLLGVAIGHML